MALKGIKRYSSRMGLKTPFYFNNNIKGDGICARVSCGWHAELGSDGFCLTRECKLSRAKRVSVYFGNTPEQANARMKVAERAEKKRRSGVEIHRRIEYNKRVGKGSGQ